MRAVRAALAAVCAAALAGCSSFPMSSAPEPFDVSSRDNGVVQFAADGPSDGAFSYGLRLILSGLRNEITGAS